MDTLTRNKSYKAIAGAVFAFLVCAGSFTSTPVHADFGDFAGSIDYILSATGDDAISASTGGNAVVRGILLGIKLCTENPLPVGEVYDAGTISVVDGLYKYNDEVCIGYEWFTTNTDHYSNDQPFVFAISKDFTISLSGPITSITSSASFNRYFTLALNASTNSNLIISNSTNANLFTNGSISPRSYQGNYYYYFYGDLTSNASYYDWDRYPTTSLSTIFNVNFDSCSNVIRPQAIVTLPSGDLDPADPYPYIENVVRPYVIENYPEYIDLLPDEEEETGAFNPLEFPPYIPDVDFHDVEIPSETLPTGLTDGAGFWFSAFSTMLDAFNLKSFVILFLCIMLVMVILKI